MISIKKNKSKLLCKTFANPKSQVDDERAIIPPISEARREFFSK